MGVSGATVRRWEAGNSKPSEMDLRSFAEICHLAPMEREFIIVAFAAKYAEEPPSEETFAAAMSQIISDEFPAYALDSLFYVRAWNSYMSVFLPFSTQRSPRHIIAAHLLAEADVPPPLREEPEARNARIWGWVRDFWMATASLCGSEPYRRVLAELRLVPEFEELWQRMGKERIEAIREPSGSPYYFSNGRIGTFRVFPIRVTCPAVYYVREYVPMDDAARQHLATERGSEPRSIVLMPERHWALEHR